MKNIFLIIVLIIILFIIFFYLNKNIFSLYFKIDRLTDQYIESFLNR